MSSLAPSGRAAARLRASERPRLAALTLIAVEIAAAVGQLDPVKLRARAESAEIKARLAASTAEFFSHQVTQRPTFVLTDAISDTAVFSGLVRLKPLVATIDTMLADTAAYATFLAEQGPPRQTRECLKPPSPSYEGPDKRRGG